MVDADRQSIQEYGILDHIERHLLFFRLTFNRSRSSRSSCSFAFKRANLLILSWSTRRTSASFSSSGWSMLTGCCGYGGLRGVLCLLSLVRRCLLSRFGPYQHGRTTAALLPPSVPRCAKCRPRSHSKKWYLAEQAISFYSKIFRRLYMCLIERPFAPRRAIFAQHGPAINYGIEITGQLAHQRAFVLTWRQ